MHKEELRERQRRRVKHRYYQTINNLNRSKVLAQKLEEQHLQLLQQHQQTEGSSSHALQRYTVVMALADKLWKEKQRLQKLLDEREKLQDRLITLLDENKSELVRRHDE